MRRFGWIKGFAFLVLGVAILAALSWVVMSLWNALIPVLFKGPVVGFWQAAGLLVLSRILFGGFRGRGGHGWRHRAWHGRWEAMTPEERDRFREGFSRWRHMSREERAEFRRGFRGGCGGMRGGTGGGTAGGSASGNAAAGGASGSGSSGGSGGSAEFSEPRQT